MFVHYLKSVFVILICSTLFGKAYASVFLEKEEICPVGGQNFVHMVWGGCTLFGRDMTFKDIATCGDYHIIPRCPDNGLPLYKDFSETEIKALEGILAENQDEITSLPVWLAAYRVSKYLNEEDPEISFWHLMFAFRYNTDEFIADKKWLMLMIEEFDKIKASVSKENAAYTQAIMAYAALLSKDRKLFKKTIKGVKYRSLNNSHLNAYMKRVRACARNWEEDKCGPRTNWSDE